MFSQGEASASFFSALGTLGLGAHPAAPRYGPGAMLPLRPIRYAGESVHLIDGTFLRSARAVRNGGQRGRREVHPSTGMKAVIATVGAILAQLYSNGWDLLFNAGMFQCFIFRGVRILLRIEQRCILPIASTLRGEAVCRGSTLA